MDLEPCEEDPGFLCGSVPVPVDRARPHGRMLDIAFMVLPHTDPSSTARDAVVGIDGGPGQSATAARYFFAFRSEPLLVERDLLLVDNRGTGLSHPIYCPSQQDEPYVPANLIPGIGECGRSLGRDSDRYGAGDIALDLEAVRKALGYARLSIDAISYGSVHAQAYAYRFPHRVRAMVLDAGMPVTDAAHEWSWGRRLVRGLPRVVALGCLRAPACASAQPDAGRVVAQLARMTRRHPFTGRAVGLDGDVHEVKVDEYKVAVLSRWEPLMIGELAAAADALRRGDRRPLVRLVAENDVDPFVPDDLREVSWGASVAGQCNDLDFVWKRTDPVPVRKAKYAAALQALGPRPFAPFSSAAWLTEFAADFCLRWPAPDRFVPAVPTGRTITGVPTLVVAGDIDGIVPVETNRTLLEVVPDARFIEFAGAAHPVGGWSECAHDVMNRFLERRPLQAGCADDPAYVPPATAEFPPTARHATPAEPTGRDASTIGDRKVVRVAVDAVRDAWLRSFRIPGLTGGGAGLRGGTFGFDYGADSATLSLQRARFARDVAVSGESSLVFESNDMVMRLRVRGPQGRGFLTAVGQFGSGDPYGDFSVTGTIAGRTVDVVVPAN